jgi:Putative abortive phage resistance protein AbiGi, antitoxin
VEYIKILIELGSYIKPIEGKINRNGKIVTKYFYDEKEWRYVPLLNLMAGSDCRLDKEEFLDPIKRAHANNVLCQKVQLAFEPKVIKYIIVNKEKEIQSMINAIKKIKSSYPNFIDILISRVISSEQILSDF